MKNAATWRELVVAIVSVGSMLLVSSVAMGEAAQPTRQQIEADWAKQDGCRLLQLQQPGLLRLVEGAVRWPGVSEDTRARVPGGTPERLDGDLSDPCWRTAMVFPPLTTKHPVYMLCQDDERLHVGVRLPAGREAHFAGHYTSWDAAGAVDGVKDGKYAFHTWLDKDPWWQVDLGETKTISRVVVYNRLDYAPGLHLADNLTILTSDDEKTWTLRYDNKGKHFGGVGSGKPLTVKLPATGGEAVRGRFVRIQVPSTGPQFLHLDEVEVYDADDPTANLALKRPAKQSSLSRWSRGGERGCGLFFLPRTRLGLTVEKPRRVTANDIPLPAGQAQLRRTEGETVIEMSLPLRDRRGPLATEFIPPGLAPVELTAGSNWEIEWVPSTARGYGKNGIVVKVQAAGPLEPPLKLTVESVVLTPARLVRQAAFEKEVHRTCELPLEVYFSHEGPAAIIVSGSQGGVEYRDGKAFFIAPVAETLDRTDRLLSDFEVSPSPALDRLRARAAALAERETVSGPEPEARETLCQEARWLAREVAFSNPSLDFDGLLFVKRFTQQTYPDVCLNHMPWVSKPGGDLCVLQPVRGGRSLFAALSRPTTDPADLSVRSILDGALGPGHVHGMDLWWDANRIVFGYAKAKSNRPPEGWLDRRESYRLRREEEPIHLFEIGTNGRGLRQLTRGEWSDLDPTYLPNGDIAFVSERCGYSLQCNEYDKDETSTNLYVMRRDGGTLRRLSVTKDGDYLPHTLDDGTIGYTRWEYQERSFAHIQSLWFIRPDGTGADALYKQHMNNPWAVEEARSIPGSSKLVAVATGHHTLPAGPVVILDPAAGMNDPAGLKIVTPGVLPPEGGMTGSAVRQGGVPGVGGLYMHPWPLSEKHFLVSYCYGAETDPTGYALYLIDVHGTKELVYRDPAISSFMPIPLRPRPRPPILPAATDPTRPYAVLTVSDIGFGVDGVAPESIRYLRLSQRLPWPYDNEHGGHRYEPDAKQTGINWTPARVLGEVPVEADGSAHFRVPADEPVYFQLLDENHMELRRMRSFLSFQPGERRSCTGCHETRETTATSGVPPLAAKREPSVPTPPPWGDRAVSFLRDVQPVFDRHCVHCHLGLNPAGGLDFFGGLTKAHNRAYDTIIDRKLVAFSNKLDDAKVTPPLAFGSHKSKLIQVLRTGTHKSRVRLSHEDWLRLVTWVDANAPYHDSFLNKRSGDEPYDLAADGDLMQRLTAIHAKRCASCHQPAEVTRLDWIDLQVPSRSLFLAAPLSKAAGGESACGEIYRDAADSDYAAALAAVQVAVSKAWAEPRRDLAALAHGRQPLLVQRRDADQ